jgi:polyketide cyclase/dehydrase/lipid transport protein
MPVVKRNTSLNVSAELTFRYLSDPSYFTEFCSNVVEVNDVQRHTPGKTKFAWVYKMMDVRILGEAEVKETKHNQQLDVHFWGGIRGSITWRLQPLSEGTLVEIELDYVIPEPLLKKHSEDTISNQNEHDVQDMLTNLKTHLNAYHMRMFDQV